MRSPIATVFCTLLLASSGCSEGGGGEVSCPGGSVQHESQCWFDCPEEWSRSDAGVCEPECLEGWSKVAGVCALPCPEGQEPVDGGYLCRPVEADVGPAPCSGDVYDPAGSELSDRVLHVDAATGSASGDGSEVAPFATLAQALGALLAGDTDASILFASGVYEMPDEPSLPTDTAALRLLGACADVVTVNLGSWGWRVDTPLSEAELARITATRAGFSVDALASVSVHDCVVDGSEAAAVRGITWSAYPGGGALVVERNRFVHAGIQIQDGLELALVSANLLETGSTITTSFSLPASTLEIADNWIVSDGETPSPAISVHYGDATQSLSIRGNWIDGSAMDAISLLDWVGTAQITDNSARGTTGSAVKVSDSSGQVTIERLRTDGFLAVPENGHGISVYESPGAVSVFDSLLVGYPASGIRAFESPAVSISGCHVQGNSGAGFSSRDATVTVIGSRITGNGIGLVADGGSLRAEGCYIWANEHQGVRVWSAERAWIDDNTVSGNGSTGIEFTALGAADDATCGDGSCFDALDNVLRENLGASIIVRSGGPARVLLRNNEVIGTRCGVVVSSGSQGSIGDGVAILTGTDLRASNARMEGNIVGGNARFGIIVHGANTVAEIDGTDFRPENGFGDLEEETWDGPLSIVFQMDGMVTGGDAEFAEELDDAVPVADDYGSGSVLNPGGGDPRVPW